MRMNFSTRSQTKVSPTKAITYPRHIFVDREAKKILKNKELWGQDFPARLTYWYNTTHPQKLQLIQFTVKTKLWLNPIPSQTTL